LLLCTLSTTIAEFNMAQIELFPVPSLQSPSKLMTPQRFSQLTQP
jgi:hypothetical protein